jgi:hypothetical protein
LNQHTWTWTCLAMIGAFSKLVFAFTLAWVLVFNWIKEASIFSIYYFSSFDN